MWSNAPQLAALNSQSRLVHGDFGHRNLLVQCIDGVWRVAAVLDWEFAISGSPLADIGHFLLRHDKSSMGLIEPSFVKGYLDEGGNLPEDWRHLAALVDLTALCESLTHEQLPGSVANELVELVRRTADGAHSR
jgi:aminoglycoside phosphotransferase (APT) family kinase protein